MQIRITDHSEDAFVRADRYEVFNDEGVSMSHAGLVTRQTRFAGNNITTLAVGGVGTAPEYRRNGCVRAMFEDFLPRARENGWVVSILHPFSFSYYRKFGYEKVSDHVLLSFPITALDFLPRDPGLVPYTDDCAADLIDLYDRCTKNRNLTFQRPGANAFGHRKYLYYENGKAEGYIALELQNHYEINRMVSDNLHIYEMGYTSPRALRALLSFCRMFEGELDTVLIHDVGMLPEVDLLLKHYTHTAYRTVPDIMARVLDTKAILEANTYPAKKGHFTVRVEDKYDSVRGVYRVAYENGTGEVEQLSDEADFDLSAPVAPFTRMVYGYDAYNAYLASFMDGVRVNNDAVDFFRAFPKRMNGLFEHF